MSVSLETVTAWLDRFGTVWREGDAVAAAALHPADGVYRNSPFLDEPYVGTDAIRGFWERALVGVSDIDFRYGTPVIDGDRAAVEWWVTETNNGEAATLAGIFLLTFQGELVADLREAFVKQAGAHQPHDGWGV
ncbi:MAG: nuclear transport factor 2 family protein [Microbacterium sp.]|uniref:nuclear transport factor 2 family protein n=1 Tax=Microbacterium sp. TaxID=51671 RepID=UPI001AC28CDC|nr:nuclear transport factor 2 family protein [Microbacterium sp.]MBN9153252.1 nuclear transport factor 2 family protein [Microbacterium sp.]